MKKPAIKKSSGSKKPSASRTSPRRSTKQPVTFEYFGPSATTVTVAGNFNQWDPEAHSLKTDAGGLWKITLRLEPGAYQYKFVIDGQRWEEDPLNLRRIANEYGTFNSIRDVDPLRPVDPKPKSAG
ncbi:hypothetical protein W02_31290 [Nitrospira sp. KM1]|uniref:isoamylase early set domain-containing protein n=1 Tax=Nitrospira sp. KM1 TaxID=1936990 RepID=UPI0013A7237F|nr:isoamylase early set domain-containing protein [Nitrospira sp. KM1]BCA55989.1 hypothetical protein W02_31290 [Nitrospira sp. KM1]